MLGLGWSREGAELKEAQDGHFCPFAPLSLSSRLLWAASLPHSQPFSASSPLTQNMLPVWEEWHMQFLNWRRGQGAYSKMEQGGNVWEPLLYRMGNKIAKMQLQLLKQTQITLLSSSESPQQDKYESFHKRPETKECYILLSNYTSCFISQCKMDLGHMFKDSNEFQLGWNVSSAILQIFLRVFLLLVTGRSVVASERS